MSKTAEFDAIIQERRGRSSLRASLLLFVILSLILITVVWAALAEIDDVTRADARIVPSSELQVVQAAEDGVLRALHVEKGQLVEQGALLLELDKAYSLSEFEQQRMRASTLAVRIARLNAEIEGRDFVIAESNLSDADPSVIRSELALFQARRRELDAELEVLDWQREQRLQDLEETKAELAAAEETLGLVSDEMAIIKPLVERRLEAETTLIALRQKDVEWRGRIEAAKAAIRRLRASLSEIDDRATALNTRFRSQALEELALASGERAELETRFPALAERVARSQVRSPVRGVVNQIKLTTLGGVARAGEALIEIVPVDEALLVEAYIRPSDIAFIHPGQSVVIKITAYDFSRYGGLDGEIIRIGAGAVKRPDRDEEVFVVQIRTDASLHDADGQDLDIVPGMIAEVDILAGRKSVLEYVTRPIVRVRDRAFRD